MNVADELELRRQLYGTGRRTRSRAEARAELMAACRALGERACEWRASAYIPAGDLVEVDAALEGIRRLISELRTPPEAPSVA